MSKLANILRTESDELRLFFEKASIEGEGTSQEVSDRREPYVKAFLEKYFPAPSIVAKGIIVDSSGAKSHSIDCNILSPSHPRLLDTNGHCSVILADGVDASIEVKGDLSNKSELTTGLKQGSSVKRLRRKRVGVLAMDVKSLHYQIPFVLFGQKCHADERRQIEIIVEHYENARVPRTEQFDAIVVNEEKLILNNAANSVVDDGPQQGLIIAETKAETLAAFLYLLIRWPKSEMQMNNSVLEPYISWNWSNCRTYQDLNERLIALG